ncbi:HDOD domain-containing protein [Actimicrobium sp. CCC2.4]|uniref:HDOD domain-containing protein n=1 Tax=Actimicrobium sp. CCC2.4 TaxID=3048606 RepID=UPI002AC97870|nr:HDOD domain-containing protein [Actimicrobium sp. CCC2.4]MEB0136900.1 HDOD domain-containing protein [Actimicrobium sp. CCC2.4]WPX33450.1 HDOD domain-containing protein [Actimicrobium sp. CCC2.4]
MTALRLEALIGDPRDLPSLPALVLELMATLDQADIRISQLADKIMLDQALAARTLRLANSPFYGMTARVVTIEQAITILGMSTVRMVVTAISMTTAFGRDSNAAFDADHFWRKAIATAICAKNLAARFDQIPGTAFLAGLLHGIGELVIATRCPDEYAAILAYRSAMDCPQRDAELAVIGFQQSAVGAALLLHWRFPDTIISAIAHHDNPLPDDALAITVHLASVLAHALDLTGDVAEAVPPVSDIAWARLSIEPAALSFLLDNARLEYNSICQALAP